MVFDFDWLSVLNVKGSNLRSFAFDPLIGNRSNFSLAPFLLASIPFKIPLVILINFLNDLPPGTCASGYNRMYSLYSRLTPTAGYPPRLWAILFFTLFDFHTLCTFTCQKPHFGQSWWSFSVSNVAIFDGKTITLYSPCISSPAHVDSSAV